MYKVPLTALPKQSIAFNVDGAYWQLTVFQAAVHVCVDISRDGSPVIQGLLCFGGIPLLPYKHMHLPNFGNFVFDADVDWTEFGTSCNLYYLTLQEFTDYQALVAAGD